MLPMVSVGKCHICFLKYEIIKNTIHTYYQIKPIFIFCYISRLYLSLHCTQSDQLTKVYIYYVWIHGLPPQITLRRRVVEMYLLILYDTIKLCKIRSKNFCCKLQNERALGHPTQRHPEERKEDNFAQAFKKNCWHPTYYVANV